MVKTGIAAVINHEKDRKYQNYLVARNYYPSLVAKQFQKVSQISCDNIQQSRTQILGADSAKFIILDSPILTNINSRLVSHEELHEELHAAFDFNPIQDGGRGTKCLPNRFFPPL